MKKFQDHELDAMLGEFANDYDREGIIEEATEIDYTTGNRYWKVDEEELNQIIANHEREDWEKEVIENIDFLLDGGSFEFEGETYFAQNKTVKGYYSCDDADVYRCYDENGESSHCGTIADRVFIAD